MDTSQAHHVATCARLLLEARLGSLPIAGLPAQHQPRTVEDAYAIQDVVAASLGPVGGWKVGAQGATAIPTCAPIPLDLIRPTGCAIPAAACRLRGAEAEIGVRIGRDLPPRGRDYGDREVLEAIAAVLPVIEVVDSRYASMQGQAPLALLADAGSNAGLVVGPNSAAPLPRDCRRQGASLHFAGTCVASGAGGNSAGDLLRLVTWLANHVARRAGGLCEGQVVTTGSWTGVLFAPNGANVRAVLDGIGEVQLDFS